MANFTISPDARYNNPNWNEETALCEFHQAMDTLKKELADIPSPVAVSKDQIIAVTEAFREAKNDFFQCKTKHRTWERLAGSVKALNRGVTKKIEDTPAALKATWKEQKYFAEILVGEVLRHGRDIAGFSTYR